MKSIVVTLAFCLLCSCIAPSLAQDIISAEALRQDFQIMKQSYKSLHPGLYRYSDSLSMEKKFDQLKEDLNSDMSLRKAYLLFSQFLAKIKCGHTYCNFWNQPAGTQQKVFGGVDKLPFTFVIIKHQLLIDKDLSEKRLLAKGAEVLSINQVPVSEILDNLITLIKADGSNDAKRIRDLNLSGLGKFEPFDVYAPLLYPPKDGKFSIEIRQPANSKSEIITVKAVSRDLRKTRITERYGPQSEKYDELWNFKILSPEVGYLQLGSFVTWKMTMNWKRFLKDSFATLKTENIPNLIIDIRDNEGGAEEVLAELSKYILTKTIRLDGTEQWLKYEKVPEGIRPYLSTWENSFWDRSGKLRKLDNGFYTWKNASSISKEWKASPKAYQGKMFLLTNAGNSSATFTLAQIMKKNKLATLVGQTTGGNLRGINGGQMFFLTLPNSQIAMDIPLIRYMPTQKQDDAGLRPDIYVEPSVKDFINGVDTELEAALQLTQTTSKGNEFFASLSGNWKGKLMYLDCQDNQTKVYLSSYEELRYEQDVLHLFHNFIEPHGDTITDKSSLRISKDEKYLYYGDKWEIVRKEQSENKMYLMAETKGYDDDKPVLLRMEIEAQSGKTANFRKWVRDDKSGKYFVRNELTLVAIK